MQHETASKDTAMRRVKEMRRDSFDNRREYSLNSDGNHAVW